MPDRRKRKTINVPIDDGASIQTQLVSDDPFDKSIIDYCRQQAKYGLWLTTFRNAMELYSSLQAGSTEVLKAQYPDLWARLKLDAHNQVAKLQPQSHDSKSDDDGYIRNLMKLANLDK